MLIIGLNGSPRPDGGTARLLQTALAAAAAAGAQTLLLHAVEGLKGQKVPFCLHCSSPCSGECYKDTRLAEFFNLLCRADGLLLGSPVYFGTVSAPLKAFWDKTRKLRKEKMLLNVVGAGVVCGGSRFGGQEPTLETLAAMMLCHGMTVVGDGHYDADPGHLGACIRYGEEDDGFERAKILGQRVAEVAWATQHLRKR
ncbi:multimeric flavodoxin WrbA [Thermodesulfitimonas autotrophica]|uniref:Multimeric flavodoxin WrbA n=1 Tax=Thermodesulfitimonas autotrophica TaxID=1894989 RepID=A0A3N5ANR1_9THEO|nr:flavodoxin family protein [Thermodesulfitimonas autotrophica]RPF46729.1 multimeric flavodoxin WrbA [Thermodesulfitimonas autotrophica]